MTNKINLYKNLNEIPEKKWEELLLNKNANFFQSKMALSFFNSSGIETFSNAIETGNQIKGLISGIILKEKGIIKSFLTRRAIILGGPVFHQNAESEDVLRLLQALINQIKKKAIYLEIRNLNDYSKYKQIFTEAGFEYHPHLNFHVDCSDESLIRKNMSKSKMRQVKKSLKEGAEIIEASTEENVIEFYTLLKHLYLTKVKTPLFPLKFFLNFFNQNRGKYFLIKYQKKIIGGIMCPILDNKVIYEWFVCGEGGKYKGIYPSVLATWAAIDYANKNGIERFDFMGAGSPEEEYGVREFKSKFGGKLVEHGRFLYVANPVLYWMGKKAVEIIKKKK